MFKINYILCKYVCILSIILTAFFILSGPPEVAVLSGLSAVTFFGCMEFFSRAIKEDNERRTLMDNFGSNDIKKWEQEDDDDDT